jgi:DNA segregation ATPase FtsK/SpoIIIE, S-DNA-T family
MDAYLIALVIAGAGVLGVVVWVLAKVGKALIKIAEALAAAAVVLFAVWLGIRAVGWALRQTVTHWRTSLTVVALLAWWNWWGSTSLVISAGVVATVLTGWRLVDLASFDAWAGRHLRSWWLRWTVYAPKLPQWLHACGLSITPNTTPVLVTVNPLGRSIPRGRHQTQARLPKDGVPVNMVQRVMGHERSSTTLDLYTRRTDDHDRILQALDDDDVC